MKKMKSLMIWAGLSVSVFAMGATGANAQLIPFPEFTGSFTLPVQSQWGSMTLPAGKYSLYYGQPFKGGIYEVEVVSKADGSPRGMVFVRGRTATSASKNELVCAREGNVDVVQALNVPAFGESIHFSLPQKTELMATDQNQNAKTNVAELHRLIEFVPVKINR